MKRRLAAWLGRTGALAALMGALTGALYAQTPASVSEDEVKAAFLYNFAKYVTWPDGTLDSRAFRICTFADPAFIARVEEIIDGETIDKRKVTRGTAAAVTDIPKTCQILFVGKAEAARAPELIAAAREGHVLTVGDVDGFLSLGGAIAFVKEGDRVRFDVNLKEASRSGLAVSSRLLRLARRVISTRVD